MKPSNNKMEKIKIIYAHKLKNIIKDIEWYDLTLLNLKYNKNAMQIPIWHKKMIILPQLSDVPSCYEDSCTSVKEELAHVSMTSHHETQFLPSSHQAMQITGCTCLFSLKHRVSSMKGSERFFLPFTGSNRRKGIHWQSSTDNITQAPYNWTSQGLERREIRHCQNAHYSQAEWGPEHLPPLPEQVTPHIEVTPGLCLLQALWTCSRYE